MVEISRMFTMIHAGYMISISRMIPAVGVIPVAPKNTTARRKQDENAEKKQMEFHKLICRIWSMRIGHAG